MILTRPQKQDRIRILDLEIWNTFAPKVRAQSAQIHSATALTATRKKKDTHNLTGLVYKHSNGDGLGYKCLSCAAQTLGLDSWQLVQSSRRIRREAPQIDAVGRAGIALVQAKTGARQPSERAAQHRVTMSAKSAKPDLNHSLIRQL